MSRNRRRHQNKVPISTLSPGLALAALLVIGGVAWIYMKHQLVARGNVITTLERQIREVELQNQSLDGVVKTLSSHATLKKRLADGFIQLQPVEQSRVVSVRYRPGGGNIAMLDAAEILPVANHQINRTAR